MTTNLATASNNHFAAPNWQDGSRIQWYGERGIVNAVVSHIASAADFAGEVRRLLQAVVWADGRQPGWVEEVTNARLLVEINLADFGSPDLILVCKLKEKAAPYVVFIEAKARPYQFSTGSNNAKMTPGYNSTINGQISLKYRFARALGSDQTSRSEVVETQALFDCYRDVDVLNDYAHGPRHLLKGTVLETLHSLGLIGLPEDHCHYVALTWDDKAERVFNTSPDTQPLFIDEGGANIYDRMKPRYGWIGYGKLQEGLQLDTEYSNACHGMLPHSVPEAGDYKITRSLAKLPTDALQIIQQVLSLFQQACSSRKCTVAHRGNSWSLMCGNKVIAKVIPEEPIYIGLRDTADGKVDRQRFLIRRSIHSVLFHGFTLEANKTDLTTNQDIKDFVEAIRILYHP